MKKDLLMLDKGFETRAIHAGQEPDATYGGVMTPIQLSTTFVQETPGKYSEFDYSRAGNPTRQAYETCLASIEKAKFGFALASGCSAATIIMHMLSSGDHVIAGDDMYGGTFRLFDKVMQKHGLKFSYVDLTQPENVLKHVQPTTKMVWLETPTNPTLKLVDIQKVCEVLKGKNILVAVDNTFSSPYFQNPISLGADLVVHSTTKYIGGHSDILGGAIITNRQDLKEQLEFLLKSIGAVASPFDCYMGLRSLKTLAVRMQAHQKNALEVAQFLAKHPKIEKVLYPGLETHPQYALARKQMSGFSGMVTAFIKGDLQKTQKFLKGLKVFALAESLGGVESLVNHPGIMTHASLPESRRKELGIGDNLLRFSVGIENSKDLIDDLEQALKGLT